ncbi:exopolyphosphatase [Pancytospora philotis]|nr:exopolyphosphatase [Pancytospora philotis]
MSFEKILGDFLKQCRAALKEKNVLVCMGNEACDVDSFVSSLVTAVHEKAVFVVNMARRVLESKGDVMCLLGHYNISTEDLIFLERPEGAFSLEARRIATVFRAGGEEHKLIDKTVRLILTDHHRPVAELAACPIELIIDHHVPGHKTLEASRLYIDTTVGSCATLVSKYVGHSLFGSKHKGCAIFESQAFCRGIGGMLMVPILVDTKNLKRSASNFDRGEFRKLAKLTGLSRKAVNKVRKEIQKSRFNDAELSTDIILQKDYKEFAHHGFSFGIATVKYSFKKWARREAAESASAKAKHAGRHLEMAFGDFRRNHGLDFLIVNRKAGEKRLLALINCPFERMLAAEHHFEPREFKGLSYYSIPVAMSRKVLVPLIKQLIERVLPVASQ